MTKIRRMGVASVALISCAGMLTAFAAPLLIGLATDVFESQRAGFAVIGELEPI